MFQAAVVSNSYDENQPVCNPKTVKEIIREEWTEVPFNVHDEWKGHFVANYGNYNITNAVNGGIINTFATSDWDGLLAFYENEYNTKPEITPEDELRDGFSEDEYFGQLAYWYPGRTPPIGHSSLYGLKNIDVKNMCTAKDEAGEQVEWSHSTMFVQPLVHVWKFYEEVIIKESILNEGEN
jgi:hypothetical protein